MSKETIRWLDVLVGSVICFILTVHRRLADAIRGRAAGPGAPRKIAFLKLIEQGATVLAEPAIRAAVAKVGPANVYFVVFRENRPVLDLLELVPPENVVELRHDGLLQFAGEALRALGTLRRAGVDTTVDMEFFARATAILAYLSGAERRVGLHRFTAEAPYRGDLMTHRVQHNPYLHVSLAYRLLVSALDEDPRATPLVKLDPRRVKVRPARFVPSEEDRDRVRALLSGIHGGRIVVLNPNTGDLLPLRMWPADRFVELGARILAREPDATIVVTGAPSEREGAEDVCRRIGSPRAISVAGKTSLRDVVVLYTMADVLVTNDSGPGHFASMTDIDNIVLFGPETPALFGPLGENPRPLHAGLACSPCVNAYNHRFSPCRDNRCMQAIGVDDVEREVRAALARRRGEAAS